MLYNITHILESVTSQNNSHKKGTDLLNNNQKHKENKQLT